MRKINISLILIILILLSSCEFNQSINKDLTTGAYSRGDGIGVDEIAIEINGEEVNRNDFIFGENVEFKFNNVSGLKQINGKIYPDLSMFVVKNEKDTILSKPNLLQNVKNGTELNPLQLRANFVSALPYGNDEKYMVIINIEDRKSDGKFHYEFPFTVVESDILEINKNGIDYSNIYLWNETLKEPVFYENVNPEHQYILILEGITGLKVADGMVFPIFSIDIQNSDEKSILSSPNILDYDENGLNSKNIKEQLVAKITFPQNQIDNPVKIIAKVKDKNSSNELTITTELNVE